MGRGIIYVVIALIIVLFLLLFILIRGSEDCWIKNYNGLWVKHGSPLETPLEVGQQQKAIECANFWYSKQDKSVLSSQCLGVCAGYAIDIVHVPRSVEDNLPENKCKDYLSGKITHFIELDKDGRIQKIN